MGVIGDVAGPPFRSLLLGCGFGGRRKGKRLLFLWALTHVCSLQAKSRRTTRGDTWESRSAKTGSKHLSGKVRGTAGGEGRRHGSTRSRRGLRPGAGGARVCPGETEAPTRRGHRMEGCGGAAPPLVPPLYPGASRSRAPWTCPCPSGGTACLPGG